MRYDAGMVASVRPCELMSLGVQQHKVCFSAALNILSLETTGYFCGIKEDI